MQTENEDAGVWPAYVAAVAGLVQSLLFVSAIMALTLLQVGMLAGRKVDETLARTMAKLGAEPSVSSTQRPAVSDIQGAAQTLPDQLDLRFSPQALRPDDEARKRLITELRRQRDAGMRRWRVSIETEIEDPLLRRAAYLRLMAVRAVFIEVGIEAWRLDLRLLPANAETQRSGLLLRIVPSREEPEALPKTFGPVDPEGAHPK